REVVIGILDDGAQALRQLVRGVAVELALEVRHPQQHPDARGDAAVIEANAADDGAAQPTRAEHAEVGLNAPQLQAIVRKLIEDTLGGQAVRRSGGRQEDDDYSVSRVFQRWSPESRS